MQLEGIYYSGQSSKAHNCTLSINNQDQIVLEDLPLSPIPAAEISISARVGNSTRYIHFPNGASFETNNNDGADQLQARLSGNQNIFNAHQWETSVKLIALSVVVLVGSAYLMVWFGIPAMSRSIANALPPTISSMVADGALESLDKHYFGESKLTQTRKVELQALFEPLVPKASSFDFKLYFRHGGRIKANAFALPDGSIIVTDELVDLIEADEELASVMLHEIGHVIERHSLRMLIESGSVAALLVWIAGDVDAVSSWIMYLPVLLVQASYSRSNEYEADTYALEGLKQHDISPTHFGTFFKKMAEYEAAETGKKSRLENAKLKSKEESKESGQDDQTDHHNQHTNNDNSVKLLDYLSSHPATPDRIQRFEQAAQAVTDGSLR